MRMVFRLRLALFLCSLSLLAVLIPATAFAARIPTPATNEPFGKSALAQDPAWVAAKLAGKVRFASQQAVAPQTCPSFAGGQSSVTTGLHSLVSPAEVCPIYSTQLSTVVTGQTMEPYGSGKDVAGHSYSDGYMWNLCAEGATTNALYYWGIGINTYGTHTYSEPAATTTWDNNHNRSYMMYLATQTKPPSFGTPGEFAYSSGTTFQPDIRDTLNWEASRHASNWANYYYILTWSSSITSSGQLNGFISGDIYNDRRAVVADVNAKYLPNWSTGGRTVNHEIAIIGYDDYNNTYAYIDSCGGLGQDPLATAGTSCGSNGAGVYHINQDTLYNAIKDNPYSGGQTGNLIW